ncbi:hypothetical protein ACEWY4_021980 [Coilia grayii]|uniref:BAH domain-containing protein n=1 Tax=Coilia grayii TaxID=363190 RepID=A0ABD1J4P7_9TELE
MTHARQKGSLSRCHSLGRDHVGGRSQVGGRSHIGGWQHADAIGRASTRRFLNDVRSRKGVAVAKKKGQSVELKMVGAELNRKHYPLRGRGGSLMDVVVSQPVQNNPRAQMGSSLPVPSSSKAQVQSVPVQNPSKGQVGSLPVPSSSKAQVGSVPVQNPSKGQVGSLPVRSSSKAQVGSLPVRGSSSGQVSGRCIGEQSQRVRRGRSSAKILNSTITVVSESHSSRSITGQVTSATKPRAQHLVKSAGTSKTQHRPQESPPSPPLQPHKRRLELPPPQELPQPPLMYLPLPPRKRRLASLNAEAVNSLLLERAELHSAAKVAKKQHQQDGPPGGASSPTSPTTTDPADQGATGRPQTCQSLKQQQQQQHRKKSKPAEKDAIDWSLFAPTPRRMAGLNAAALLKLTSSSAASKQRAKTDHKSPCCTPAERKTTSCTAAEKKTTSTRTHAPSAKKKQQQQLRPAGHRASSSSSALRGSGWPSCRKKGGFESAPRWEEEGVQHAHVAKVEYHPSDGGVVAEYPLKQVKEEQVEEELSPFCCCGNPPPGASLEYCCHRLGIFLRQQPGYPEAEEGPFAPVKQECLVTPPPSLAHPSLALSAHHHPCLCADHCFSSYYVHMAHPRAPPLAALGSRPLTYATSGLCRGPISPSAKLLAPGIAHSSGIPHPSFCSSPCYNEPCSVSPYTYRPLPPVATRGCSFSTGCSRCRQEIKTEGYLSPRRDHSPSLLQVPPAVPLSGCPLPRATPQPAPVPHLLSPLSEPRQGEAGVGAAGRVECPQGGKPSNGSLPVRRPALSLKEQVPTAPPGGKQRKVVRRRTTNGWRAFGVPVEREVFVVGEDEPVLRRCFEGVRRDGEEIGVRDTVLLRSGPRKKSQPYVAKISAIWEEPKTGELMMSLFWYYRPEHTQGGRDPSMHCENEIFASKHQDVNSVACIEDKCYVLPLTQFCRYCALVKRCAEGVSKGPPLVPSPSPGDAPTPLTPPHRQVPADVHPDLVYLCRHVYDFRYGRILKNPQ